MSKRKEYKRNKIIEKEESNIKEKYKEKCRKKRVYIIIESNRKKTETFI